MKSTACVLVLFAMSALAMVGASPVRQAFHLDVLSAPVVARLEDGYRIAYEVHVTNFATPPLTLNAVRILDADTNRVLSTLEGDDLASALMATVGTPADGGTTVAPGARAIVYVDVPVSTAPRRIRHTIEFDVPSHSAPESGRIEGAAMEVSVRRQPILGPPLKGGPWVAVYEPQLERGHRRVVYAVDGRARIPGRFAIDWMKPRGSNTDGYDADVLAVADATVVKTRDDFPARTADLRQLRLEDAAGNFIALDLGDGLYVFYEHLRPGIRVKAGDRVQRGQVIAALGSSGQASIPHLHLHVSDAPSPLGAEGMPFMIDNARILGGYPSLAAFLEGVAWRHHAHRIMPDQFFPSPNLVVSFPGT